MAKDHYIAQTYLRHFIDPASKKLVHAYDKTDGRHFTPTTRGICCEEDWDTIPYFANPRAITAYLNVVEPKWNTGVSDINKLLKYEEVKYFMAGYIAVMAACSPTAVRASSDSMAKVIASSGNLLARQMQANPERFPDVKPLPDETFKEFMDAGGFAAEVDPKSSQARMASQLINVQWHFYKSPWMVMINETYRPFLTHDFPVGFYYPNPDARIPYRYVPISPKAAILVKLSLDQNDRKHPETDFKKYPQTEVDIREIKPDFVDILNTLTVQGAEKVVVADRHESWIEDLVKEYVGWRMDSGVTVIPYETGSLTVTKMMPRKVSA